MKYRYLLPLLSLLLLVARPAAAHRPDWGDATGVTEVNSITVSTAFYRDVNSATQADTYRFAAQAGQHLHAGINIPAVRGLENYHVAVALVGPGLPPATYWALPFEVPTGIGAVVFPSERGEDFFEPFTQTNYWGRQRLELDLPTTGPYYLVVWQPEGRLGKYVLDIGTQEVFGSEDLFLFPGWWLRVHDFFGHTPYLVAALGLGLLALGGALWLRQRAGVRPA